MNFQCTTAAFTVSHEPEGFVILGSLAQRLGLVCGFWGTPSLRRLALLHSDCLRTAPRGTALALG